MPSATSVRAATGMPEWQSEASRDAANHRLFQAEGGLLYPQIDPWTIIPDEVIEKSIKFDGKSTHDLDFFDNLL
jgi:hypothetical protein